VMRVALDRGEGRQHLLVLLRESFECCSNIDEACGTKRLAVADWDLNGVHTNKQLRTVHEGSVAVPKKARISNAYGLSILDDIGQHPNRWKAGSRSIDHERLLKSHRVKAIEELDLISWVKVLVTYDEHAMAKESVAQLDQQRLIGLTDVDTGYLSPENPRDSGNDRTRFAHNSVTHSDIPLFQKSPPAERRDGGDRSVRVPARRYSA
jgi:hypothetical protein